MSVLQIVLAVGLLVYLLGAVTGLRAARMFWHELRGVRLVMVAWVCIALSYMRFVGGESDAVSLGRFDAGHAIEIVALALGAAIIGVLAMRRGISSRSWRLPVVSLFFYSLIGLLSIAWGPSPHLIAWKAIQLLILVLFVFAVWLTLEKGGKTRHLVEVTYGLATLVMASAALAALVVPEQAFKQLYAGGGGIFGVILYSVWPHVHPNTLGIYAGILVIVALRRFFDPAFRGKRVYYAGMGVLALSVQFAAQSRGSIVALVVGLIVLGFYWSRVRGLIAVLVLLAAMGGAYQLITSEQFRMADIAEEYLRRGQSEKQIQSMSGRTGLWDIGMDMFADRPMLGHGFQTGVRYGGVPYGLPYGTNLHNSHFQVLVDSGLIGYSLWMVFLISGSFVVYLAFRRHKKRGDEGGRFLLELFAVVIMLLVRTLAGRAMVALDLGLMFFMSAVMHAYAMRRVRVGGRAPTKNGMLG